MAHHTTGYGERRGEVCGVAQARTFAWLVGADVDAPSVAFPNFVSLSLLIFVLIVDNDCFPLPFTFRFNFLLENVVGKASTTVARGEI